MAIKIAYYIAYLNNIIRLYTTLRYDDSTIGDTGLKDLPWILLVASPLDANIVCTYFDSSTLQGFPFELVRMAIFSTIMRAALSRICHGNP
jgi:hypothetical protein